LVGAGVAGALRTASMLAVTFAAAAAARLAAAATRSEKAPARVMAWWGRSLIRLGGFHVRAEGLSHLPREGAVLAANHQSLLDIPLILSVLPGEVRFMAKQELGRIPLFGKAMVGAGNLLVDREEPREALLLMREAVERVRRGQWLVVFPEGTRSGDGEVGQFRTGVFHIAHKAARPLIPLYIDGGSTALPKGSLTIRPARLFLRLLPAIAPGDGCAASKQAMADEARRRILEARAEERTRQDAAQARESR
jgi:1-acyl-sn-glycerol-3-phosphate acyltransferase